MTGPVVEFEKVAFSYDTTEVLREVSFKLYPGEVIGLLSSNGAGKSTTLKMIAGLVAPTAGRVRVAGLPMPECASIVKRHVGYIPESAPLPESLTGEEYLEQTGRAHGIDEDALPSCIADALASFEIAAHGATRLDAYSRDMRQRILLAAALMHDPDLLVLDEPLAGLDDSSAMLLVDLIAALAAEGKTILYSSHDLDIVEKVCDRILTLQEGILTGETRPAAARG